MQRVNDCIIMAAGMGTRLAPLSNNTPKPLVKINGKPMIETLIEQIKAKVTDNITIVVGYKAEQFKYLIDKYNVQLYLNDKYETCNNISSMFVARHQLGKHHGATLVCDADLIINNIDILKSDIECSGYYTTYSKKYVKEWMLELDENDFIKNCNPNGGTGWELKSISYWTYDDAQILKANIEKEFIDNQETQLFWDNVMMFKHKDEVQLKGYIIDSNNIEEIDTFDELCKKDNSYKKSKFKSFLQKFDNINFSTMLVPMLIMIILAILLTVFHDGAENVISVVRNFLGNDMSVYYLAFGLAAILLFAYMAFSKIGKIRIGKKEDKPINTLSWGILIFTSTMAADILFYAFHEWTYYWNASTILNGQSKELVSSTYSFFHWGFIPWAFYLILAAIYAFMFFNKERRDKQNMSEACRPILGKYTDKAPGKIINAFSVFGLLCGTATTFSVATPLMTAMLCKVFGLQNNHLITVLVLVGIATIYTTAVLFYYKGISIVSKITTVLFSFTLALFLIVGDTRFILESGFQGLGNMVQNFFSLATWVNPIRGSSSSFAQDWTVFYWAYWIAWCVATPFFIAKISKGMTIKKILLGGMTAGLLGTFSSFIIFGGFGMGLQSSGAFDAVGLIESGAGPAQVIVEIIGTLKYANVVYVLLFCVMACLYASTFDALTDVVSSFSYKRLDVDKPASKKMKVYWALVFLILPITLIFFDGTSQLLMSVAIIGAFPLTIIMILIVISFFKDLKSGGKQDDK